MSFSLKSYRIIEMKLNCVHRFRVICFAVSIACLQTVFSMDFLTAQTAANQEKDQRTAEQEKIDSQLLYAIYQMRGEAGSKGVPTEPIQLEKDRKGRVLVDIRAPVTKKVLALLKKLGGTVVSSSDRYHSIIAYLPLGKLEELARSREVKFIAPKAQSMTN
jgi:hypothetical protein